MMFKIKIVQPCLVCGEPVSISAARPTLPEGQYTLLFTCTNPDCCLCMRTFDATSYNEQEVERYCGKSNQTGTISHPE